jgi:phage gp45-like
MKKYLLLILFLFLCSCDETSLDQINRFSGRWGIVFKDNSGNILREGTVTLQDNGAICDKVKISASGDSVYFTANVSSDGYLTGNFGDSCNTGNTGTVTGALSEILGIVTGTGNWNDTSRTPNSSGMWEARRQ